MDEKKEEHIKKKINMNQSFWWFNGGAFMMTVFKNA